MTIKELSIKHRYTKPYCPQTNRKIERLWRTINSELLDEMVFDSEEHLKEELMKTRSRVYQTTPTNPTLYYQHQ